MWGALSLFANTMLKAVFAGASRVVLVEREVLRGDLEGRAAGRGAAAGGGRSPAGRSPGGLAGGALAGGPLAGGGPLAAGGARSRRPGQRNDR